MSVRSRAKAHLTTRATAVALLSALVAGLLIGVSAAPAAATPGPWTWVEAEGTGSSSGQGAFIAANCPSGYRAVTGGVSSDVGISSVRVGTAYTVQAFTAGGAPRRVDVTAWCAPSDQLDVEIDRRTLYTDREGHFGVGLGTGDFACSGDRTPVSASMTWQTSGAEGSVVTQSGPEVVGGTVQWFVTAQGANTSSALAVDLLCVANSDLPSTSWVTQSAPPGAGGPVTTTCPTGQRLLSGGVHVDSINGYASHSAPVDFRTWTATADVPTGDTLTVGVLCVPTGDPVAAITAGPGQVTATNSATFTFTATDPAGGSAHDYCFLDTSGLGDCSWSDTVTGLGEGQHVFSVEAYTDDGRGWAPTEKDYYFWVDLTAPSVSLATPPSATLGATASLRATGADNQAVAGFRYTVTAHRSTGAGAASADPVVATSASADGSLALPVTPGTSYRVTVRAVDWAGNVSTRATPVSTAAPLDNLDLTASAGWSLIKGRAYTHSLVSRTTTKGATLAEPVYGTTVGVVATTCATCGRIGVYAGSTLVRTIDLHSTATRYQQVTTVRLGSTPVQTTLTLRVLSSGQRVEVDGVGAVI